MRLTFSILWFDDSEEYFDSLDLESLRQEISSWGFFPDIKLATTPKMFYGFSPFEAFDLIVVDRKLEDFPNGQEFIAELRSNAIYTEVIFYTAGIVSDLWSAVHEKQLEGIFVSHRDDILTKIFRVGRQSIRKVLDLENIRGIVMAEVGELDHLLGEIIKLGMASLPPEQQKTIINKFYEGAMKQKEKEMLQLDSLLKNPVIDEMLDLCDSNKRWQNFNRIKKSHDRLREAVEVGDYEKDVLVPRNALAHGKPKKLGNGEYIFDHRGKEYYFNDDTSLDLRRKILEYKRAFSHCLKIIND